MLVKGLKRLQTTGFAELKFCRNKLCMLQKFLSSRSTGAGEQNLQSALQTLLRAVN